MTETKLIRALIVSEQLVIRRGLEAILRMVDDLRLVGEASSSAEVMELIEQLSPDVLLVDIAESSQASIDCIARVRRDYSDVRIVALSSNPNTAMVSMVISAGANSWILKDFTLDALSAAIRSTMDGQSVLAPEVVAKLVNTSTRSAPAQSPLTERETQVLELMGEGLTNREIAAVLVISHATVKYHITNILAKLGSTHRSQAIVVAMKQGLIRRKG